MPNFEYSPYKAVHHLDALKAGNPVSACWLITHRCNQKCEGCYNYKGDDFDPASEPNLRDLKRVALELKDLGVKAISLTGGEPTLHKHFHKFSKFLLDEGFDVGLITNGTTIVDWQPDILSRFKYIRISINAMRPETYEMVCKHNPMMYWERIKHYLSTFKAKGCWLGSSMILRPSVLYDITHFAQWSKDAGFDTCRFGYMIEKPGLFQYTPGQKGVIKEQLASISELSDETFHIYPFLDRMKLSSEKDFSHCYASDLVVVISADLSLYRCGPKQNDPNAMLGNLREQSLGDIWESRGSQDVSHCQVCWANSKNIFMQYLMEPNPKHINFV